MIDGPQKERMTNWWPRRKIWAHSCGSNILTYSTPPFGIIKFQGGVSAGRWVGALAIPFVPDLLNKIYSSHPGGGLLATWSSTHPLIHLSLTGPYVYKFQSCDKKIRWYMGGWGASLMLPRWDLINLWTRPHHWYEIQPDTVDHQWQPLGGQTTANIWSMTMGPQWASKILEPFKFYVLVPLVQNARTIQVLCLAASGQIQLCAHVLAASAVSCPVNSSNGHNCNGRQKNGHNVKQTMGTMLNKKMSIMLYKNNGHNDRQKKWAQC